MSALREAQSDFVRDVAKLIVYADEIGVQLTFGEAHRTKYQQERYIATGRSKTMNSKHLSRLAIDFFLFVDGDITWDYDDYEPLGKYWESLNPKNTWGGSWKSFKDLPHFQRDLV